MHPALMASIANSSHLIITIFPSSCSTQGFLLSLTNPEHSTGSHSDFLRQGEGRHLFTLTPFKQSHRGTAQAAHLIVEPVQVIEGLDVFSGDR